MNASIELSEQLYKASGWDDTQLVWSLVAKDWEEEMIISSAMSARKPDGTYYFENPIEVEKEYSPCLRMGQKYKAPVYDIGYLLEKLSDVQIDGVRYFIKLNMTIDRAWRCVFPGYGSGSLGHTPADAAAKMCINLIKDGVFSGRRTKQISSRK